MSPDPSFALNTLNLEFEFSPRNNAGPFGISQAAVLDSRHFFLALRSHWRSQP